MLGCIAWGAKDVGWAAKLLGKYAIPVYVTRDGGGQVTAVNE